MIGKKNRIIAGVVVILIAITTALLIFEFDSPELGKAVLQRAADAAAIELSAERFRLKLLKGLVLDNVQANGNYPGGNFHANAKQLLLEHDLLSLLRGKIRIHTVVLQSPEIQLIPKHETSGKKDRLKSRIDARKSKEPQPSGTAKETKPAKKLDLQVSKFNIKDGTIVSLRSNQKEEVLRIEGFNVEMKDIATGRTPSDTPGLFANGIFDAKLAQTSGISITGIHGSLNTTPERALLENIHLRLVAGDVQVKVLKINTAVNPVRYSMEAKSSAVNMNYVLKADQDGDMGPAQITLNLEGTHGRDPEGYGTIWLGEGKLPAAPVFVRIDAFLKGKTKLVGLPYKALPAKYTLNGRRITLPELEIQTTAGRLRASGWTDLKGVVSLAVQVLIPREQVSIKELPSTAIDLITDDKGQVNVPFRVDGPIENPLVEIDLERVGRTAGDAIRRESGKALKEAAKDAIRNFLKKRNKPD
jgi:hypothetical protein